MWYSFNYGLVHFISINTETDFDGAPNNNYTGSVGGFGDQTKWLGNDLIQADRERSIRPWIIVLGHRPLYRVKHGEHGNGRLFPVPGPPVIIMSNCSSGALVKNYPGYQLPCAVLYSMHLFPRRLCAGAFQRHYCNVQGAGYAVPKLFSLCFYPLF